MNELAFKQFIFSEQCELTPYSLLLLLYIKMQNREKYVFYNQDMMSALKIKDIRCLRKAKDELLTKGFIRQKTAGRGFKFVICMLDESSTSNVLDQNQKTSTLNVSDQNTRPSTLNAPSTFDADNLVRLTQQPSTFDAEKQYVKRTTKINNKETIKETNKVTSDSDKPAEQIGDSQQETTSSSLSLDNFKNENEKTEEQVKAEPKCMTERYKEYQDVSEFDEETQKTLAFLSRRFS